MPRNDAHKGKRTAATLRREAAVKYQIAGMPLREIGRRLGVSHETIRKDVARVMDGVRAETQHSAAAMITLESERLDMARFAIAAKVIGGDLDAVREWVRISESYRKLHGLDAPTKIAPTNPSGDKSWQLFDPKELAEKLSPRQLELLEEILTVLETYHAPGADELDKLDSMMDG